MKHVFFIMTVIASSAIYGEVYRLSPLDRGSIGIKCGARTYIGEKGGLFINFVQNGLILLRRN